MSEKATVNLGSLKLDFTNVEEATGGKFPSRMTPGLWNFTITGLEGGVSTVKQTPYLEYHFIETGGESVHKDKFYLTPGALPRLKHMLLNAGVNESTLSGSLTAEQLSTVSIGKGFHGKLSGREFINKEGELKIAAEFAFAGFAEPTGTETLKFDATKDIKKMPINPANRESNNGAALQMPSTVAAGTDDLPF